MTRRVIAIDQESCIGCGTCVRVCEEGAIGLVNGKAYLLREEYCDGLGSCLPSCPQNAIHFVVREAAPFSESAAERHVARSRPSVKASPRASVRSHERSGASSREDK